MCSIVVIHFTVMFVLLLLQTFSFCEDRNASIPFAGDESTDAVPSKYFARLPCPKDGRCIYEEGRRKRISGQVSLRRSLATSTPHRPFSWPVARRSSRLANPADTYVSAPYFVRRFLDSAVRFPINGRISDGVSEHVVVPTRSTNPRDRIVRVVDETDFGDSEPTDRVLRRQRLKKTHRQRVNDDLESAQKKKAVPTSLGNLYAKDCNLKLIADHTFHREIGRGDGGIASNLMTSLVRRVDGWFRRLDLDGDGFPNQIGFRVSEIAIYEDAADYAYPLGNETLSSKQVLSGIKTFASHYFCYTLVFTQRSFADDVVGRSFSWNEDEPGGICGNERQPNVGFVTVARQGRPLSRSLSVLAVARVLGYAFGGREDRPKCSTENGTLSILSKSFPGSWTDASNVTFSNCSLEDIKETLAKRSSCLLPVFMDSGLSYDQDYYTISRSPRGVSQSTILFLFMTLCAAGACPLFSVYMYGCSVPLFYCHLLIV